MDNKPAPIKGTAYEIHMDYARRYLKEHGPTDPLDLAVTLREVFRVPPFYAEEIAIEACNEQAMEHTKLAACRMVSR